MISFLLFTAMIFLVVGLAAGSLKPHWSYYLLSIALVAIFVMATANISSMLLGWVWLDLIVIFMFGHLLEDLRKH